MSEVDVGKLRTQPSEAFEALVDGIEDYAIVMLDPDGFILSWNSGAQRIEQYESNEILGRHFSCFYTEDDVANRVPELQLVEARRSGRIKVTGQRVRKDGSTFLADVVISAIYDRSGALSAFGNVTSDVTARAEAEHRFRDAMEFSPIGLGLVALDGKWLTANTALSAMLGRSEDEFRAMTIQDITIEPHSELHYRQISDLLQDKIKSYQLERQLIRKDGSLFWGLLSVSLVRNESGVPQYFIGQAQDITHRKTVELQLSSVSERMKLATSAGQIGIWEMDLENGIGIWDERMYRLWGVDPVIAADWDLAAPPLHTDDRARIDIELQKAYDGVAPFDTEFRVIWPGGEVHNIRAIATVVRDPQGRAIRMVGTNWDITQIRLLSDQLKREKDLLIETAESLLEAKQAAETANGAKTDFLTTMSHELRTPMNGILGFAQLLETPVFGSLTTKQAEFVEAILRSGRHLLDLINDILELSKIESGKLSVSVERVELPPMMKSVISALSNMAEAQNIALVEGQFGPGFPAVLTDRVRLIQSLINLGSNAIKYNRPGGRVDFSYDRLDETWVRLRVTDTGIGIPAERHNELFQPFNRLGAAALAIEGTGVGLALTRRLVEAMGGRVGFTSVQNAGSCFWIDLPVFVQDKHSLEKPARGFAEPMFELRNFSLLYAEDNPSNMDLMRNIVETLEDVRLIEAIDGAAAIELAKQHRPDVIILDLNLPDISGYEVLQTLKSMGEFTATQFIALSASVMPSELRRGLQAGFSRYLMKPIEINLLMIAIEEALAAKRGVLLH
jgi:PAS domain S-box-containing protein